MTKPQLLDGCNGFDLLWEEQRQRYFKELVEEISNTTPGTNDYFRLKAMLDNSIILLSNPRSPSGDSTV